MYWISVEPMCGNLSISPNECGWCVIIKTPTEVSDTSIIHAENMTYDEAVKESEILYDEIHLKIDYTPNDLLKLEK